MYKTIVLAYDGSSSGQQALLDCKDLAQWNDAVLWLVAVMPYNVNLITMEGGFPVPDLDQRNKTEYQKILADGLQRLEQAGYAATGELLAGEAVQEITRFARKVNADLIVVGHKHVEGWARWWSGSISGALVEHSPCSVFCVVTQ
ncbi:universal stress protein [Rhodoferax sp.]|uniref:universal stress protein n=1 Tax=Rhodoferax sp. TaxID=50421 RepID=UPI0025FE0C2F|nr:universal stress protein [Rhodoferax sp.]MCM2295493.1 universal stress protein [Rhodoferax sp.]MDD3937330.1 universal stress protein [Rhodoferax sp.]